MVIVAGMYELAPELREAFLDSRKEAMRTSREETGCLEYVASADPSILAEWSSLSVGPVRSTWTPIW